MRGGERGKRERGGERGKRERGGGRGTGVFLRGKLQVQRING